IEKPARDGAVLIECSDPRVTGLDSVVNALIQRGGDPAIGLVANDSDAGNSFGLDKQRRELGPRAVVDDHHLFDLAPELLEIIQERGRRAVRDDQRANDWRRQCSGRAHSVALAQMRITSSPTWAPLRT